MALSISPPSCGCCAPHQPWDDAVNPSAPPTLQILHGSLVHACEECQPCISLKFLLFSRFSLTLLWRSLPKLGMLLGEGAAPQARHRPSGGCGAGQLSARLGMARHSPAWLDWARLGSTRLDGRTSWCSLPLSLRAGALPSASPEGASLPKQVSPMLRGTAAAAARCLKVSGLVCWPYIPLRKDFLPYPSYFPIPQQCGFHVSFGAGVILAEAGRVSGVPCLPPCS